MIALLILLVILLVVGGSVWGWTLLAGVLGLSGVNDKAGALRNIRQLMVTYEITLTEVETTFLAPPVADTKTSHRDKSDIAKTLFTYLGAVFILAGISTYIGTFWEAMGGVMRVVTTLGVGYILLAVLISALHEEKYPGAIVPLTLASVVMLVGGSFVLINQLFPEGNDWRAATLCVAGIMALHWAVLFTRYQRTLFALIALIFVYAFMYVGLDILQVSLTYIAIILGSSLFLVGTAIEKSPQVSLAEPAILVGAIWLNGGLFDLIANALAGNWASLIVGLCLMFTAFGLSKTERYARLTGLGYLAGSVMLYAGLFDLVENTSIELVFLGVTAALLYACVVLQSNVLLLTTILAMLSYIGYFSAEHFADSLGWPITLVLVGLAFVGVGTVAIKLRRQI